MKSAPTQDDVIAALGDKVVGSIVTAVADARGDLATYRESFPGWVAEHSATGLANWINDRVWANLKVQLDDLSEVTISEHGHTREFFVGHEYRLRVKRHDPAGKISSYPTQGALEFYELSETAALPGLEELCLTAGYIWDKEARALGAAVVALSEALGEVPMWLCTLPGQDELPASLRGPEAGPVGPSIETSLGYDQGEEGRAP